MAGEYYTYNQENHIVKKGGSKIKRGLFWLSEKSTYVTFPISGVIFVAGAATGTVPLMAAGGVGMGADIVQNRISKRLREREAQKATASVHKTEQGKRSGFTKIKDIVIPKGNTRVKYA